MLHDENRPHTCGPGGAAVHVSNVLTRIMHSNMRATIPRAAAPAARGVRMRAAILVYYYVLVVWYSNPHSTQTIRIDALCYVYSSTLTN